MLFESIDESGSDPGGSYIAASVYNAARECSNYKYDKSLLQRIALFLTSYLYLMVSRLQPSLLQKELRLKRYLW